MFRTVNPFYFGIVVLQVHGQALQRLLSPTVDLLALSQHTSDIPIHPQHFLVGGVDSTLLGKQHSLFDLTQQYSIAAKIICQTIVYCLFYILK